MTQSSVLYGYRFDSAGMSPDAHVFDVAGALEQPRWLDKSKDMELSDSPAFRADDRMHPGAMA